MSIDQIIKLIDAGYNKEEIASMMQEQEAQDNPVQPEESKPKAQEEPNTAPAQQPDKMDILIGKMDKYMEDMAKLAIMGSQQPARESTQDFLAKIINPQYGKENN